MEASLDQNYAKSMQSKSSTEITNNEIVNIKDPSKEYQTFLRWMRRTSEFFIKKPEIIGKENLRDLPDGKPVIFATTHLSDIDVQTVAANLGQEYPLNITSLSSNQKDPIVGKAVSLAGRKYFIDVESKFENGKPNSKLNSENTDSMVKVLDEGRSVVVAAHNPSYDMKLTKNPGRIASYVASETGDFVVPVAIDVKSDKPVGMAAGFGEGIKNFLRRNRKESEMIIGKPIQFEKIEKSKLELVDKLLNGEERAKLTNDERVVAEQTHKLLIERGSEIMSSLAESLPPQKRGNWDKGNNI